MSWEEDVIKYMIKRGWKCQLNDENQIEFAFYKGEKLEWIRVYYKKNKHFIQFNGKEKVNLQTFFGNEAGS